MQTGPWLLFLLVCPVPVTGVLRSAPASHAASSLRKVARLVCDISDSLEKSTQDASLAFQSLLADDQQLSIAMDGEIKSLQQKLQQTSHNNGGSKDVPINSKFTKGSLKSDIAFKHLIAKQMASKKVHVDAIKELRQKQMGILLELKGIFSSSNTSNGQAGYAFLELSSVAQGPSLRASIEHALRNKEDTHHILMQIQEMLKAAAPVAVEDVQAILKELGSTLQMVEQEKSHADEASKRCQEEETQRQRGRKELETNIGLMRVANTHAEAAMRIARKSMENISAKIQIVQQSPVEYAKSAAQPLKLLERQAHDRATIRAAVQKAEAVVSHVAPTSQSIALFRQLGQMLDDEEEEEKEFQKDVHTLQSQLESYAQDYIQLLGDHKLHLERTLSGLELYVDELRTDTETESKSLEAGKEMDDQSEQLCDSILSVIAQRAQRRAQLDSQLRDVFPRLLDYFGTGADADVADLETDATQDVA